MTLLHCEQCNYIAPAEHFLPAHTPETVTGTPGNACPHCRGNAAALVDLEQHLSKLIIATMSQMQQKLLSGSAEQKLAFIDTVYRLRNEQDPYPEFEGAMSQYVNGSALLQDRVKHFEGVAEQFLTLLRRTPETTKPPEGGSLSKLYCKT